MRNTKKAVFSVTILLAAATSLTACFDRAENAGPTQSVSVQLPDFTRLVEQASPAVVNISTTQERSEPAAGQQGMPGPEGFGDWLRRFFENPGQMPRDFQGQRPERSPYVPEESLGSGFIISSDGDILTNYHVVADADEIIVRLSDRRQFTAKVIGHDELSDLALLKIEADDLPVVKIGNAQALKVGEWVLAIGTPFGFDHSVTAGIVSAKSRHLNSERYVPFIQTDVAINPGNSGGPLFNLRGEVVGVNSQIFSRTGGYMGLSFAIPMDVALDVVNQLRTNGTVSRGWLGVVIQELDRDLAQSFGLEKPEGALVVRVMPDSPAADAGVEVGDVILGFNGEPVTGASSLPPLVGRVKPGEKAKITVLREGNEKSLKVAIGELDENPAAEEAQAAPETEKQSLGIEFNDLTPAQRDALKVMEGGVLITAVVAGPAEAAGMRRGDVLLRWAGKLVENAAQLQKLIAETDAGSIPVLIQRDGAPRFMAIQLK